MEERFDYYGLFVNESDKAELAQNIENIAKSYNISDYKVFCDHVTLLHNSQMTMEGANELKAYLDQNLGKQFAVEIISIGISDKCIACGVKLPDNIKSMNARPHITMITRNGGKPFMSNQITKWDNLPQGVVYQLTLKKIAH